MSLRKHAPKLLVTCAVAVVVFFIMSGLKSGPHLHTASTGPDWPALLQGIAAIIGVITGPLGLIGVLKQPASNNTPKDFHEVNRQYDGDDAVTVWIKARDENDRPVWDKVICRPGRGD